LRKFHHNKLPDYSALLIGRETNNDIAANSDYLQIWYNNTDESWVGQGEKPHKHDLSDECFIVLRGNLLVLVEGKEYNIGPHEFCLFPRGVYHAIKSVHPPAETFMIRAPSVEDKTYQD